MAFGNLDRPGYEAIAAKAALAKLGEATPVLDTAVAPEHDREPGKPDERHGHGRTSVKILRGAVPGRSAQRWAWRMRINGLLGDLEVTDPGRAGRSYMRHRVRCGPSSSARAPAAARSLAAASELVVEKIYRASLV